MECTVANHLNYLLGEDVTSGVGRNEAAKKQRLEKHPLLLVKNMKETQAIQLFAQII